MPIKKPKTNKYKVPSKKSKKKSKLKKTPTRDRISDQMPRKSFFEDENLFKMPDDLGDEYFLLTH